MWVCAISGTTITTPCTNAVNLNPASSSYPLGIAAAPDGSVLFAVDTSAGSGGVIKSCVIGGGGSTISPCVVQTLAVAPSGTTFKQYTAAAAGTLYIADARGVIACTTSGATVSGCIFNSVSSPSAVNQIALLSDPTTPQMFVASSQPQIFVCDVAGAAISNCAAFALPVTPTFLTGFAGVL